MRRHGTGMGRGRMNPDRFEYYDEGHHRGGTRFGLGHHEDHHRGGTRFGLGRRGFQDYGRRSDRLSTTERIEYLEDFQRDLEEMTADLADQLDGLRRRESGQAAS
ncbi:MAG: hypothetical protein U9R47_10825 [Actinomycetota bacterium]|nr:hypothetical protein [Actinomycetota bacterium]